MIHKFLTVRKIENFIGRSSPFILLFGTVSLIAGLIFALFLSPPDYQQGDAVRIMYVHVPSAWMALFIYSFIAVLSFGYLVWKNPLCYLIAKSAAPIGAYFTLICLVTGSIWGYPMWGTWWVWDARLTSVLILFFIYLGYLGLSGAFNSEEREAKSASVLALVGIINIPIIKYSVEWWNTLHQPASVFRITGPTIDNSMLLPLLLMAVAWMCIFAIVIFFKIKTAIYAKKLERAANFS
jgi:heme exporter protein C